MIHKRNKFVVIGKDLTVRKIDCAKDSVKESFKIFSLEDRSKDGYHAVLTQNGEIIGRIGYNSFEIVRTNGRYGRGNFEADYSLLKRMYESIMKFG